MAIQISATIVQLPLLTALDLTTIESNLKATYVQSQNRLGYTSRKPGFPSAIPDVIQPSAAGQVLKVVTLDVNTPFSLPDGIAAVMPVVVTDPPPNPGPAVSNFTATLIEY